MEDIAVYGPYGVLVLMGLGWLAKNVWPVIVKRDESDRAEQYRREDQLIELVKNNTAALTRVVVVVEHLSSAVTVLYGHLNLPLPEEKERELNK